MKRFCRIMTQLLQVFSGSESYQQVKETKEDGSVKRRRNDLPRTIRATLKEAVANAEISQEKEIIQTRPRFARSETGEIRRPQRTYDHWHVVH